MNFLKKCINFAQDFKSTRRLFFFTGEDLQFLTLDNFTNYTGYED